MASGSTVADSGEGALPRTYDEAVRQVWRPLAADGGLRELVRASTLAANSHNTQPWRFWLSDHEVTIHPDFTRRCPAVDPDDHHLFISLGCAVENMVQAAPVLGFDATSALNPSNDGAITLALERRQSAANPLADAIVRRQCTRADYDGRTIAPDDLASLEAAGTLEGVTCLLITDRSRCGTRRRRDQRHWQIDIQMNVNDCSDEELDVLLAYAQQHSPTCNTVCRPVPVVIRRVSA